MFGYALLCVVFNLNKVDDMLVINWLMDSFVYFVTVAVVVYLLCYIVICW